MWKSARLFLLAGGWLFLRALGQAAVHDGSFIPDHVLRVSRATLVVGCESREAVVVNGTLPGPPIHLRAGSRSWIRVYNDLANENLTMHWHGLSQRMAPFADGTPQASQWPIPPGHFYDYEILTHCDDPGTFFYHSHVDTQALTTSGPLIIDDDAESSPYSYDEERIFHFTDHMANMVMDRGWVARIGVLLNGQGGHRDKTAPSGGLVGHKGLAGPRGGFARSDAETPRGGFARSDAETPRGGLAKSNAETPPINIKRFKGDAAPHDRDQQTRQRNLRRQTDTAATPVPDDCPLPVIDVEPGKTYRFRFIGAIGLSLLTMGFEGHDELTIVQVDGSEYVMPVTTDHLQIASGQRFDVIFTAKTAEELAADGGKSTYYLQFETRDSMPYIGYAVLRYSASSPVPGPPSSPVVTLPERIDGWLEYAFTPLVLEPSKAPTTAEVTRRIIIECEMVMDNSSGNVVWQMAHQTWTPDEQRTPPLVDIYLRGQSAIPNYEAAMRNYGWDPATQTFPAKVGEVLEVVLQNIGSRVSGLGLLDAHPMHSHGKHYFDVGSGPGQYNADANDAKLAQLGYRPVRRDTTMLYKYADEAAPGEPAGWRAWRVRVDSPGVWLIHCHLLHHMMMGMQTVWVTGDAEDIIGIPLSVSASYFTYQGSVMGNETKAPEVYEFFDKNDEKICVRAGGQGSNPIDQVREMETVSTAGV